MAQLAKPTTHGWILITTFGALTVSGGPTWSKI
jgi:hypothetical protein